MQGENMMVVAALPLQAEGAQLRRKEEIRIPQWSFQETKEFIAIRAELEKDFTQTKRNKTLWETISGKMKEKGYRRSADQCKCKWKNIVNRYKGKETSELDNGRQCPFSEELDSIFKERERNMDRLLLESESGGRPKQKVRKLKGLLGEKSSDDYSDDDEDEEEDSEDEKIVKRKKRRADKERQRVTADKYRANSMQEVLEDFFQQQQRFEEQWREDMEAREKERRLSEREWRDAMERLDAERCMHEQAWREREDQRRSREEARAERRDELFAALINKIIREEGYLFLSFICLTKENPIDGVENLFPLLNSVEFDFIFHDRPGIDMHATFVMKIHLVYTRICFGGISNWTNKFLPKAMTNFSIFFPLEERQS